MKKIILSIITIITVAILPKNSLNLVGIANAVDARSCIKLSTGELWYYGNHYRLPIYLDNECSTDVTVYLCFLNEPWSICGVDKRSTYEPGTINKYYKQSMILSPGEQGEADGYTGPKGNSTVDMRWAACSGHRGDFTSVDDITGKYTCSNTAAGQVIVGNNSNSVNNYRIGSGIGSQASLGNSGNSNASNNTDNSNSSSNNLDSTVLVAQIVNVETEDWLGPELEAELSFEKLKKWRMARLGETRFDYCMRRGPFYFESERQEYCTELLSGERLLSFEEQFGKDYGNGSSSSKKHASLGTTSSNNDQNKNFNGETSTPVDGQNCTAAETDGSALNVRATPNGELINRLRNGREIAITQYQNDNKGRPWGYATGYYNGEYRNWGWVFMASLDCGNDSAQTSNNKTLTSSGFAHQCVAAETEDTALNVRATPNGELVNRLRNGRQIEVIQYKNDSKGRPWGYAIGEYNGEHREWGWVFMASVRCQ